MTNTEILQQILSNNWSDVYDICDTVEESIDYIYNNTDKEDILEEEWDLFTDMVDDAYHYGFTDYDGKTYQSMEK